MRSLPISTALPTPSSSLRKKGGISGFPKRCESSYDPFGAGHSGTAISAAVGFAEADRLSGIDSWTVAVVGDGSFTNGIIFHKLGFGNKGNVIAVMLEPLTQANIITANPIPIFSSNFIGGGLAGIAAAVFGIVNNAPGTASPIPGLLAPFAFNSPLNVVLALVFAILGGSIAGLLGSWIFGKQHTKIKISTSVKYFCNVFKKYYNNCRREDESVLYYAKNNRFG